MLAGMEPVTRMTMPVKAVLSVLLAGRSYGMRIARDCKLSTGTVYVILARLERAGLASSSWEDRSDPDEPDDVGAPRRYWVLTQEGRDIAGKLA